jgi:ribonuclease HI
MSIATGPVFVQTDGSALAESHPNGPSVSVGYRIEDNGVELASGSEDVTPLTDSSNAAEYIALERALVHVRRLGFEGWIFIKTDSLNLVNLLESNAPRSGESERWLKRINTQLDHFAGYSISKTSRQTVRPAHELAQREHHE